MISCPLCDNPNIEGEDICQACGQPLSDLHLQPPPSKVERSLLRDRVSELEPPAAITVAPDTPVRDVLKSLVENRIGCMLIVENDVLVGIFSERDALQRIGSRAQELADQPVSEFMTAAPQSLDAQAKVAFAAQRMDLGGFRHVPIVDADQRATGVVSVRDILRYLHEKMSAAS